MAIAQHPGTTTLTGSGDIQLPGIPELSPTTGTKLEGIRDKVFMDRYAQKNERGEAIEQYPEQMWARIARAIADAEPTEEKKRYWSQRFFEVLSDFKFVPGGRILSGAGTGAVEVGSPFERAGKGQSGGKDRFVVHG